MFFDYELGDFESLDDLFEVMYGTIIFNYEELRDAYEETNIEIQCWGFYKKNGQDVCYTYVTSTLREIEFYQEQLIYLLMKSK